MNVELHHTHLRPWHRLSVHLHDGHYVLQAMLCPLMCRFPAAELRLKSSWR